MKVGDMVCYNAGGMKRETLGLVMEIDPPQKTLWWIKLEKPNLVQKRFVLIMWSVVGRWMPRKGTKPMEPTGNYVYDYYRNISSGDLVWHELGDWFEVVK